MSETSRQSGTQPHREWEIGQLKLRFDIVWSFAMSSLKVRLARAFLTVLTITTATAFMMFIMTQPTPEVEGLTGEAAILAQSETEAKILMLLLALIVAAAGVLNTMLMSVTQRYREIGTIKCLGALDSLVLLSVLVEAAILGLIGAVGGLVAGLLITLVFGLIEFGGEFWSLISFNAVVGGGLIVLIVGMLLTTLGAMMPAWIASKMPPVEAMAGEK